jgi:hypothetical protein
MGGTARRGQQFSGSPDSPDVVTSISGIHLEVKRTERGNPYGWIDQAVRDAGEQCPVVLHRRNKREWLLIVRLDDAPRMLAALNDSQVQTLGGGQISPDVPGQVFPAAPVKDGGDAGVL